MPKQAARHLRETERRIHRQIGRIQVLEDAGRITDARRAREVLAVITETRDALRLRLAVAREVLATTNKRNAAAAAPRSALSLSATGPERETEDKESAPGLPGAPLPA